METRIGSYTSFRLRTAADKLWSMTTVYDVPARPFLASLADHLRGEGKVLPPDWAPFVRTGVHTEKAPVDSDWWHLRVAAVLRKVYLRGPIGTTRLAAEFGGRRDDGSAPYHARRGSRAIARYALQVLEGAGYLRPEEKAGRVVSPEGQRTMDRIAHDVLVRLAAERPELAKYLRTG